MAEFGYGRNDKSVKQEWQEIGSEQQQQFTSKYAKHFRFTEQILHPKLRRRTMKCASFVMLHICVYWIIVWAIINHKRCKYSNAIVWCAMLRVVSAMCMNAYLGARSLALIHSYRLLSALRWWKYKRRRDFRRENSWWALLETKMPRTSAQCQILLIICVF